MSTLFPTILVSLIVAGIVALAARYLWTEYKSGHTCSGGCASCSGGACGNCGRTDQASIDPRILDRVRAMKRK